MEKSNSVEVTIFSAEELLLGGRPIEKNAYVTVRTDAQNFRSTTIDRYGGSVPSWNETFRLALPSSCSSITVEVDCKTRSGSTKTVGKAIIPTSDILKDYVPAHLIHFLSYRLRDGYGGRNGIINLSVRMVGPDYADPSTKMSMPLVNGFSNGIAVGIPISRGIGM